MATPAPSFVFCIANIHTSMQVTEDSQMTLDALRKYSGVLSDTHSRMLTIFRTLIDQYFMQFMSLFVNIRARELSPFLPLMPSISIKH